MVVEKAKVRKQIIAIARIVFTRYGFRKATMDQIALASEMGKSSIYYYFKSKEDIFKAVVEKEAVELYRKLNRIIKKDVSPMENLKAYVLFRLHHLHTVSNFYAALKEEQLTHLDFIKNIRKKFDRKEMDVVKGILDRGIKEEAFQIINPEIGAIAIATMMKGLELPLFLSDNHKTDKEKLLDELIGVLFYGIIKR
jgi:AcrR family transcriptional regulator